MSECVILYRVNNGLIEFVYDGEREGTICTFAHLDAAIEYADNNKLFQSGQATFQIVECDEL